MNIDRTFADWSMLGRCIMGKNNTMHGITIIDDYTYDEVDIKNDNTLFRILQIQPPAYKRAAPVHVLPAIPCLTVFLSHHRLV